MLRFLTSSIVFSGFWSPAPPPPCCVHPDWSCVHHDWSSFLHPRSTARSRSILDLPSLFLCFQETGESGRMQNGPLFPRFSGEARMLQYQVCGDTLLLHRYQHLHRACLRSPEKCKKVLPVLQRERKCTRFGITLRSGFLWFLLEKRREKRYRHIGRAWTLRIAGKLRHFWV